MCFCESAQQIHIFLDVVRLAVGTLCLDEAEIDAILHRLALVGAVPSFGRMGPLEEFLSPSVEDLAMKVGDALVAVLRLVDVVDAVAVGTEGIRHEQHAL